MTKAHKPAQDDQETQLPPDDDYPAPPDDGPAPDAEQGDKPEPLTAGQFDQQGSTWDDSFNAATDNPTHPLRHLKGVV